MADELKPPVAIRITRPYATEAEFLEREFDTLTHTSVVLLGAQARPQGVVLRFEIVLKNGESILRGEGRVVGYKERAHAGEPGLSLRFTRLDSRSKTLVDRASSLREARVRASTSLMSMPAVVVPRAAPPPSPEPPRAVDASARPASPPNGAPSRPSSPPPSRRAHPPALPGWAKLGAPRAISPPVDVETTQVDAHFDLEPPATTEPAARDLDVAAVVREIAAIEMPPLEPVSVEVPVVEVARSIEPAPTDTTRQGSAPPPARAPIRPTPARPPPLPRSVPQIPRAGSVPPMVGVTAPAPSTAAIATEMETSAAEIEPPIAAPRPIAVALQAPTPGPAPTVAATPKSVSPVMRTTRENLPLSGGGIERPAEREALLVRLRQRGGSLSRMRVDEILAKPAR